MGHGVACQDDGHEVVGIGQREVAGAEEAQDGSQEQLEHEAQHKAHRDVHDDDVAQDVAGRVVVLLPEAHRHERRGAHAHHGAEGRRERHDGPREGQSHDGPVAHTLSDENAVDNVVNGRGSHGHDGRDGIFHQQATYGFFSQFVELVGFIHINSLYCVQS